MLEHKFCSTFYANVQTFYEVFGIRPECVENSRDGYLVTAGCFADVQV